MAGAPYGIIDEGTDVSLWGTTPAVTGGASRSLSDRVTEIFNIRDFGAIGDGNSHTLQNTTSYLISGKAQSTAGWTLAQWQQVLPSATALTDEIDWCAAQAALNAALAANGHLRVPGVFVFNRPITGALTNLQHLRIEGRGVNTSKIIVNVGGQGGIALTTSVHTATLEIVNLSVLAGAQTCGTAISYVGSEGGNQYNRVVRMHNVVVGPQVFESGDQSFSSGIILTGFYRPLLEHCFVFQSLSSTTKMAVGIGVDGCYKPHLIAVDVHVTAATTGISHVNNSTEGFYLVDSTIDGPDTGLLFRCINGNQPAFHISRNHFNCVVCNVQVDGAKRGWIDFNLFYCQQTNTPPAEFVDILIQSAGEMQIFRNSYGQIFQTTRRHVRLDATGSLSSGGFIRDIEIADVGYFASTTEAPIYIGPTAVHISVRLPLNVPSQDNASYPSTLIQRVTGSSGVLQGDEQTVTQYVDSGSSGAPQFTLVKNNAAPAANDAGPVIIFNGTDSTGTIQSYAELRSVMTNVTHGSTAGTVEAWGSSGGSLVKSAVFGPSQVMFQVAQADQSLNKVAPTTGQSLTIPDGVTTYLMTPAGTLATLTLTTPATPVNGQRLVIMTSQAITALTLSPNTGQSISAAPTSLAANSAVEFIYQLSSTNWYRKQ